LNGLQCPKLLWVSVNDKKSLPDIDPVTQHIFDQGHKVGELAKQLYPGGYDIPDEGFIENIRETREMLKRRIPVFEAGIMVDNLYARADILDPVGDDEWDIIEVKSSTSVKDVNLHDVAFQKYCYQRAGLSIGNCYLAFINNKYVLQGAISPQDLFTVEDISEEVVELMPGVGDYVEMMLATIASGQCPERGIGPHCSDPYGCDLKDACWGFLPEHSVFTLYYAGKKGFGLLDEGVEAIVDIPDSFKRNDKQQI